MLLPDFYGCLFEVLDSEEDVRALRQAFIDKNIVLREFKKWEC